MLCPKCRCMDDQVVDSRIVQEGAVIRRRRECTKCKHRFTTYEELSREDLCVIKKDGRREKFAKEKIRNGLVRACEKRPVSMEQIDRITETIVRELEDEQGREIPSRVIGDKVLAHLKKEDEVAFVRYASVYRQFRDLQDFVKEINTLAAAS